MVYIIQGTTVISVTNTDGTLAFSPTSGAVIGSIVSTLNAYVTGAVETLLTTTNPTTIATLTPAAAGNYLLCAYFRVITASTTVTLTASWTDATGAQTYTWVNAVSENTGSYTNLPLFISDAASGAITISATAGTINQVYVSASIMKS